jgi:hypothetical protein
MNERPLSFEKRILVTLVIGEENIVIDDDNFIFCKQCDSPFSVYMDTEKDEYVIVCKGRCFEQ